MHAGSERIHRAVSRDIGRPSVLDLSVPEARPTERTVDPACPAPATAAAPDDRGRDLVVVPLNVLIMSHAENFVLGHD